MSHLITAQSRAYLEKDSVLTEAGIQPTSVCIRGLELTSLKTQGYEIFHLPFFSF